MNFSSFVDCVLDVINTNRQKSTLSEPFEFGVYVGALMHSHGHDVALETEGLLPVWRDRMLKIMKTSNLSFKDFCDAVRETGKCDPAVINEMTYGSRTSSTRKH